MTWKTVGCASKALRPLREIIVTCSSIFVLIESLRWTRTDFISLQAALCTALPSPQEALTAPPPWLPAATGKARATPPPWCAGRAGNESLCRPNVESLPRSPITTPPVPGCRRPRRRGPGRSCCTSPASSPTTAARTTWRPSMPTPRAPTTRRCKPDCMMLGRGCRWALDRGSLGPGPGSARWGFLGGRARSSLPRFARTHGAEARCPTPAATPGDPSPARDQPGG